MPDYIKEYKDKYKVLVSDKGLNLNNFEDWKHNKLNFIKKNKFVVEHIESINNNISQSKLEKLLLPNSYNLIFISGVLYSVDNDNIANKVYIDSINNYLNDNYFSEDVNSVDNYFEAINNANFTDGYCIVVKENISLDKPINIIFANNEDDTNKINNLKNYIILEKNSAAKVLINYLELDSDKDNKYFLNNNTNILLAENADLLLYKMQNQSLGAYNVSYFNVNQNKNSNFKFYNFIYGSLFSKDTIRINLNGEQAFCGLYGIISANDKQYLDVNTRVHHNVKNCSSFENYKGLADDKSTAVFNGSIVVKEGASNSDARMSNKNLLLSDNANIYTKPELKIYNDDVKCSHGTTIGSLDSSALFYLQSRGLSYENARKILVDAFLEEIVNLDRELSVEAKDYILSNLKN